MKKIIVLIVVLLCYSAFSYSQVRTGALVAHSVKSNLWGAGFNGEFFVKDKLSLSPNALIFLPEETSTTTVTSWELNMNINYYFLKRKVIELYGIIGLNFFMVEIDGRDKSDAIYYDTHPEWGFNVGLGTNVKLAKSRGIPFFETTYTPLGHRLEFLTGWKIRIKA